MTSAAITEQDKMDTDEIKQAFDAAVAAADEEFRAVQRAASEARRALSPTDYAAATTAYNDTMRPARERRDAAIQAARVAAGWE